MAFQEFTGKLDEPAGTGFVPFTGQLDEPLKKPIQPLTAEQYKAAVEKRKQETPARSISDAALDTGITLLKGAIGLPEAFVGLVDIPTMGRVGKFLEDSGYKPREAKEILDTYLSEGQQAANRKLREAQGFFPTIQAALENPSTIATAVGESAPQMVGGAGIARGLLKAAPAVAPFVAGAVGEGLLGAGSAAEQIRGATTDKLLTPKQAVSAVGSGAGTALFGAVGGRLAQKLGFTDIDTLLASGPTGGASKSVADFTKKVLGSGISEGVFEEMPQSAQETMWMNYATDKPLLEGVPEAAGMGAVTGFAMGVGGGGANAALQRPPAPVAAPLQEPAVAPAPPSGETSFAFEPLTPEPGGRVEPTFEEAPAVVPPPVMAQPTVEAVPGMMTDEDLAQPENVSVTPVTVTEPEVTPFTVPAGFAYTLTESPAYKGIQPMAADDVDSELEFFQDLALRNRLTPQVIAQSEIGKRLDTGQITSINTAIKTNSLTAVQALQTLREAIKPLLAPAAAPEVAPVAPVLTETPTKDKWLKAINDQNRLQPEGGVQLTVTPEGKLNFMGDPSVTKQGRALEATLNEAIKAGATVEEIAESINRANQPAPQPVTPVTPVKPTLAAASLPEAPTVPLAKTPKLFEPTPDEHELPGMPVVAVPVKDLKLSEDVPQFKSGASAKGLVEPLRGKFTTEGVAPIAVWRRLDGSMEVISGRHRLDLAQRSGTELINAQVYEEAQGFDANDASMLDAELNIRDEQGKVKDYVNYFKASGTDKEAADAKGLLGRVKGKRGFTIANQGSDALISAINADQVGDEAAYYIALNAPNNERLQNVGLQAIMDGKSMQAATNTMQAVKALAAELDTTTDMFGYDDSLSKEAQAMEKIATKMQQSINSRLSAITGAAKNPAMAKAEGIDIRDPEAIKRRIDELKAQKAALENWSTSPELVAEIRAARGVAAPVLELRGETEAEIRDREATQDADRQAQEAKDIADRERDFFQLQPQVAEREEAPTMDMFAGEAAPSAEYQAASELANRASAQFRKVQEAYRSQEIGDDDFLAGRKVYDTAMAEFDKAVKKEQGLAEPTEQQSIKDEKEFIEESTKDKLEAITQDFMVGDMVRFGSIPGTVVGLEGDYVRMRPDVAKSAKAYQRVPKTSLTFVGRPDTTSMVSFSKEQANKFGEEAGQLNANMGNLIQLLGANMYSSSLAEVTVKELLQNAFDAVKGAVADTNSKGEPIKSLYKKGKIQITINSDNRTISISDNARGMTPQIVRDAFFTVAGSDKSDLPPGQRSGGLGLAKMGFMLGAENLKLDTVRDGVRVTVDTSSVDIANNNFKIQKSPAPKGEHGTTVTVRIPQFYIDPKNGDEKTIYFPYSLKSIEALNKPLIGPVEVSFKRDTDDNVVLPVGVNFAEKNYTKFKANFDWGSADIFFGIERKQDKYSIKHQVLSAGVYQFSPEFELGNEKIPYDIVVNIAPNVDARHPDYPFVNSRESFKPRIKQDVQALQQYLGQISRGLEARDLQDTFKGIVSMPRVEAGQDIADISAKLKKTFGAQKLDQPTEVKALPKEVTVTADAVTDTETKQVLVDVKAKREEKEKGASFKGSETPKSADFMLDMKQNPKLPAYHNNTNVDYLAIGRPYGEPEQFFAELGTLVVEMKEELAKSGFYGYEKLLPENLFFAGVSIDKQYGGVHIKVPYKAIFVNPFYSFGGRTLFGIRQQLLNTMIHEIAHTGSMDHGVSHNTQMVKVEQYLADEGLLDYYRDAILDTLRRHESTFTAMKEAYDKSSTQNTSKSLEDYSKDTSAASSRGDDGGDRDKPSAVSSGEGQGRGEGVSGAKADDAESQNRRGDREAGKDKRDSVKIDYQRLHDKYARPNTPQLDQSPLKTQLVKAGKLGKDFFTYAVSDPLEALGTAANSVDRAILYARNKNVWFGSGLNAADFSKYNGDLVTSQGLATASVALDNAIRGGQIATEVIFQGGIKFDPKSRNFVAVKRDKGMSGVYEAETALKKRLGDQLGTDIIQGYLEAKRSRSIQNEYFDREAEYEFFKSNLEELQATNASEEDIMAARDAMAEAKEDLKAIELVYKKVKMSDQEIDEFIALDRVNPELRKIMTNWSAINKNMLEFWRQVGLLSEKRYESLSNIKDYVPWQRIMNDETDVHSPVQASNRKMTNIGLEKLFKKGKPTVITDFVAKDGQQDFKIQPAAEVEVEINGSPVDPDKFTMTADGQVKLDVPVTAGDLVVFKASREIENIIDNMTRNVMRMTMNGLRQAAAQRIVMEYATRDKKGKIMMFPKADRERGRFDFIVNGQRVVVEIQDPLIAESIFGMESLDIAMLAPLAAVANFTRRTITLSGVFQIKQVFKDAPTAALVTGVKHPLLLIGGVYKGFVTSLLNTDPTVKILKAAGIGGFQSLARTPEAEIKRRLGIMNRNVFDFVIKGLDHIGDSSDMAQRVAVYKRVLAETGNETQALYQAANVINFLHHGSGQMAQAVVKTVPFAGAYANSMDVLIQALAGGGLKGRSRANALARLAMTGTLLAGITLLYCMLVGDDEEYNQMDDQTKMRNFMIPGTKVILPMNTSGGYFYKAVPEMLYNKIMKEGTKNAVDERRLRTALKEAAIDMLLGPTPVPSGIKPFVEIGLNKDFFTGRPIVPESLAKLEAAERYVANTSEAGKFLSSLTGTKEKRLLDPLEADHIIRGIFGTAGAMGQWFSNSIAVASGERVAPTDKEQPITGSFLRTDIGRRNEDLFYDFKAEVDKRYGTYAKMLEREDDKAADAYEEKHSDIIDFYQDVNKMESELKEINAEIRYYGESKDTGLTPDQRREEIKQLQLEKQEMLDDIIEMRKEAGL